MTGSSNDHNIAGLKQKKVFKIIVLGDSGVGKTCLTYRFCEGQFLDKSEATIGVDFRERTVRICNEEIKLQLWDTAGQERFRKSMVQHYYRNVHAVVIVYDVTKPETFHSIASWMQEVESHGLTGAPRVLVGNKCDCGTPESRLATAYAQRLADKHGMPLFETSALLDSECDNVESIFMTLAHKLYSKQPLRVVRVEGEPGYGVVTLPRQRKPHVTTGTDNCLCS
ncbi:Ras-related protein Rab-33B [Papilio machaon]|uniref:Ras-related protein Rab-33B n=1 Tax=Papilio machaon TaxID=76193 RepID=A0A0N1I699_PAPMA|nr:putative Ras-related protein Rab-33 [Papilio machaon]KPJ07003.1 Ras-related protein Rab-33B [Papilio machaon]